MPLSPSVFQLPIPSVLFIIPPSHPAQWIIRISFLFYSLTVAIPTILILVPISVYLAKWNHGHSPLLSLHPDNLPPRVGVVQSILRGWMVYIVGTIVWAITGVGNAPESDLRTSRLLNKCVCVFVQLFAAIGVKGPLVVQEEVCEPIDEGLRIGAMRGGTTKEVVLFSMRLHVSSSRLVKKLDTATPADSSTSSKALLFLAGGGYVTGVPLAHPFVCSLIRRLPPDECTVYAPYVRKSLDRKRSFPVPLLDALAAYQHLRRSYAAADIIVMGDSAGGGLSWSLTAYLAVLKETRKGDLGIPGGIILISPWLSLPPTTEARYPDWVDTPQLLNAARCYMARYPILKNRPDPFVSDPIIWPVAVRQLGQGVLRSAILASKAVLPGRLAGNITKLAQLTDGYRDPVIVKTLAKTLDEDTNDQVMDFDDLDKWLDPTIFSRLSSHHPLVSPGTNLHSPFVQRVLDTIAKSNDTATRIMVYTGTAEWFHVPSITFAQVATKAGVKVDTYEIQGGFHAEGCVWPGEMGGAAGKLVDAIEKWLKVE